MAFITSRPKIGVEALVPSFNVSGLEINEENVLEGDPANEKY